MTNLMLRRGAPCPICPNRHIISVGVLADDWACGAPGDMCANFHSTSDLASLPNTADLAAAIAAVPSLGDVCPDCNNGIVAQIDYGVGTYTCRGGGPLGGIRVHIMSALPPRPKAKKIIEEYPHRCPRCHHKAYVGINEVDHQDPWQNATCATPRSPSRSRTP